MGWGRLFTGERETTQHGIPNDILVPTLRLLGIIRNDEIMIAAIMLLLPIGYTLIGSWVLPAFLVAVSIVMLRLIFEDVETKYEFRIRLGFAILVCIGCFVAGYFLKDAVYTRLEQAGEAIWQWPPRIGYFFNRVAFVAIPFFIPILTRPPLLTNFFKITLLDPTWPSPRMARDIEGIQSPDYYDPKNNPPVPETETVTTVVSDGNGHDKRLLLEKTPQMQAFAKAILSGASFNEATVNDYLNYGRGKWLKFRRAFFDRGWAVWKNAKHHQDGILLLKGGREALRNLLPHSD